MDTSSASGTTAWNVLLLAAVVWAALASQASAHSPYFTRSEIVTLPDGSSGEMRMLHGDGILFADPVRILLLDNKGQLLARSGKSTGLTLVCDQVRQSCKGYDRHTLMLWKPAPAGFEQNGLKVDAGGDRSDSDPIWGLEAGDKSWGFVRRPAPLPMIATGLLSEASDPGAFLVSSVLVIAGAVAGLVVLPRPRAKRRKPGRVVLWLAYLVFCLLMGAIVALLALIAVSLFDLSISLTAASLLLGTAVSAAALWFWGRLLSEKGIPASAA